MSKPRVRYFNGKDGKWAGWHVPQWVCRDEGLVRRISEFPDVGGTIYAEPLLTVPPPAWPGPTAPASFTVRHWHVEWWAIAADELHYLDTPTEHALFHAARELRGKLQGVTE